MCIWVRGGSYTQPPPGRFRGWGTPACSRPAYGVRYSPKKAFFLLWDVYVLPGKAFVAHFVRSSGRQESS